MGSSQDKGSSQYVRNRKLVDLQLTERRVNTADKTGGTIKLCQE